LPSLKATRPPKPVFEFKVSPAQHGKLYYVVRVFKSVDQMRAFLDTDDATRGTWSETGAVCRSWRTVNVERGGRTTLNPELGDICFHLGGSQIGVISHECLHATLFYLRRRKLWFDPDVLDPEQLLQDESICGVEEYACHILGNLVGQVVRKGYACGWFGR
jgi:hypothetical protein